MEEECRRGMEVVDVKVSAGKKVFRKEAKRGFLLLSVSVCECVCMLKMRDYATGSLTEGANLLFPSRSCYKRDEIEFTYTYVQRYFLSSNAGSSKESGRSLSSEIPKDMCV